MSSILVVEDSAFMRGRIVSALKMEGNEVWEAANGREGVEKIRECRPDCVILDLLMPEMNGLEVLATLQQENSVIPVIVLSADIQETTQSQCLELGAVAFLEKPVQDQELIDAIHGVLCAH